MMENSASNTGYQGPALAGRSRMTEELSGRRIVVPETRELDQLVRLLEERGAEAIPCPMIAIRDAPDAEPIAAWLRRFADGRCDDLVLMTGEGLRRLLGFARRTDLEFGFPRRSPHDTQNNAWAQTSSSAARGRFRRRYSCG